MSNPLIVIEGNIGAGKTSLARRLGQELRAQVLLEKFEDNPFLPLFYQDPERHAFALEMSFLAERREQLAGLAGQAEGPLVADYHPSKSLIFASQTLKSAEMDLYRRLFRLLHKDLPQPTRYVYLHREVPSLLANIAKRGRGYEQGLEAEYLARIERAYFDFLADNQDFPAMILDMEGIDFLGDDEHYRRVRHKILHEPRAQGLIRTRP